MKRRLAVKLTPAKVTMLMLVAVASLIGMYVIKGLFAVEKKVARPQTVNIPLATAYLAPGTKITDTHTSDWGHFRRMSSRKTTCVRRG